jgi:integrase
MSRKGRSNDGLYKRGARWYTKIKIDGEFVEKSTGTANYNEAKQMRATLLADAAEGQLPNDMACWTLDQALEDWLSFRQAQRKHGSHAYEHTIAKHLKELLGTGKLLKSITPLDLRAYQKHRLKEVSNKAINNELQVLRTLLKQANLWRRIESQYVPLPVEAANIARALSVEEAARLVAMAQRRDAWHVALCATVLSLSTGMRSNEIKNLRLGDVELNPVQEKIVVRREGTKTRAGVREIALNQQSVWAVANLLKRAAALGSHRPEHYLLPLNRSKQTKAESRGHGYDPTQHQSSWSTAWESLKSAVGIPTLRFHDLRTPTSRWLSRPASRLRS